MEAILRRFLLAGTPTSCAPYGNGHINDTYAVTTDAGKRYILQRINTAVFHDPVSLMKNIRLVSDHIAKKAADKREAMVIIKTREGDDLFLDETGAWRVYAFVEDSLCLEKADTPALFRESARAFGRFFNQLSDFDPALLTESIPHFHDTPLRLKALKAEAEKDGLNRLKDVKEELRFALKEEAFARSQTDLLKEGKLPLRVTHNDTKINNVLFDKATGRGLCVIDLDTVMPGLILNDFGDSIRFGANTAAENEPDLSKVSLDLNLFRAYCEGYLTACGSSLTPLEKQLLPAGARMMTYENGIRFLTDYLAGDRYFHISHPEENLWRARTQFKLIADMDGKWNAMERIIKEFA